MSSSNRGPGRVGALLFAVGAIVLWLASRLTWLTVGVFDNLSGEASYDLVGGVWSTEATAVALLLLAASVAALALRRLGRRVVGVVGALAAIGASWTPLDVLVGEPDPQRAHQILTSGAASQRASDPVSISSWAEITGVDVHAVGPVLALIGCALALVGGVLIAMRPGTDGPRVNRYERQAARREHLKDDLEKAPDSGRVMWDALDDDIDPTDVDTPGPGSTASRETP